MLTKEEFDRQYGTFETEIESEANILAGQINSQGGVLVGSQREKVKVAWTGNSFTLMTESNYKFAVDNEII